MGGFTAWALPKPLIVLLGSLRATGLTSSVSVVVRADGDAELDVLGGRTGRKAGAGDGEALIAFRGSCRFATCLARISFPRASFATASFAAASLASASRPLFEGGKAGRLAGSNVAGAILRVALPTDM